MRPTVNELSSLLISKAVNAGVTHPTELAAMMGNASVETGSFSTMHEYLGYTSKQYLISKVSSIPSRFKDHEIDDAIASRDPKRIATLMYERRSNLGNNEPGDGYRFHGRGYLQFTGRSNYRRFGDMLGFDLISNPDVAADPEVSADLAIAYWKHRVNKAARSDAFASGHAINGGDNGAPERVRHAAAWRSILDEDLIRMIQEGEHGIDELRRRAEATQRHTRSSRDGLLKTHSHGPAVEKLQSDLNVLGHTSPTGQPLVEDGHFGPSTAHAVRTFQATHALTPDGIAGLATQRALRESLAQHRAHETNPTVQLTDACHPAHAMYLQAREHVYRLDAKHHRESDQRSDNLAAALTAASVQAGMTRIDQLTLGDNADKVWATQRQTAGHDHFFDRHACVNTMEALNTPWQQSSEALAHVQGMEQTQRAPAVQQQVIDYESPEPRHVMRH